MSRQKKYIVAILLAVAVLLCSAIAVGAGCGKNKKKGGKYEISFDTGDHAAVASVYADGDEVITLPEAQDEGVYVFVGWYTDSGYSGDPLAGGSEYTVTGDATLYAKFNIAITLNLGGGTLEQEKFSLGAGENVSAYMNEFIPEYARHQFDYWADENGREITSSLTMPEEGLTLTAVYKVEISAEVWVWNEAGDAATHMSEYDRIDYETEGKTNVWIEPVPPSGLVLSSNQNGGTGSLAKVDADPDKNVIKYYYDAQDVQWSYNTNYPSGTGLASTATVGGTVRFGEEVVLPTDVTCYGYLLVGWSTDPDATTPDFAVDVVTPNVMVWSESDRAYVRSGAEAKAATFRPEELRTTVFAVWQKGYTDMFSSYDVIYDLGGGDTVYLCRGGAFWESEPYDASSNSYSFVNRYYGDEIYRVRLRSSDGCFVYVDGERRYDVRYRIEFQYDGNPSSGISYSIYDTRNTHQEYFRYTSYDTVEYYIDGYLMGVAEYGHDSDGFVTLRFTSGDLEGTVYTIYLMLVSFSDGSTEYAYFIRQDDEYLKKITFGGVGTDEYGAYKGLMNEDSYYFELSGFNTCTYYVSGQTAEYHYWLEDGVLTIFYSDYSYAAEYHYVEEFDRYIYYYSSADGTFDVYSAEGSVIGTATLDGLYGGTITMGGETKNLLFYISTGLVGDMAYVYTDPDSYDIYYRTEAMYVFTYDDSGVLILEKLPDTYHESYYFDPTYGLNEDMMMALEDNGEGTGGTATIYLYGYSYSGYYLYFSVITGTYEVEVDDTYGFTYYVMKDIEVTNEIEQYGVEFYYPATYLYEELTAMTEIAFLPMYFVETYEGYSYYYEANVWYYTVSKIESEEGSEENGDGDAYPEENSTVEPYTDENENAVRENLYEELTGTVTVKFDDGKEEIESDEASMIIISGYLVYVDLPGVLIEIGDGDTDLVLSGYFYSYDVFRDEKAEQYFVYLIYFTFGLEGETYSWVAYVKFDTEDPENETFETMDSLPYYVYLYDAKSGNLSTDSYVIYDMMSGEEAPAATYVSAEGTRYEGTISGKKDESGNFVTTNTGYYLYVFEGTNVSNPSEEVEIEFAILSYSDGGESYPVYIIYEDEAVKKYSGGDGSSFTTDGLGIGAVYDDGWNEYVTGGYYVVASDEDKALYGDGYYGYGYIEFYLDGNYYILDFTDEENTAYTVRGLEYWYTFLVVDNQILKNYVVEFDGYGNLTVLGYEDGAYAEIGSGTYELVDTVITYTWSYTGDSTQYSVQGVLDTLTYSGYTYACVYVEHEEYSTFLVDSTDFSVLVMDGSTSIALRYLTDGSVEYGWFTMLDTNYVFYENLDGDFAVVYECDLAKGTMKALSYGTTDMMYVTNDLTKSMYLSTLGEVTFDNETYSFYVRDGSTIYVYYIPESDLEANAYGYVKSGAITLGDTITMGEDTYTRLTATSLTFTRKSGDSGYGYLKYVNDAETASSYGLGELTFANWYTATSVSGTITMKGTSGDASETVNVYRRYSEGEGKFEIYIQVGSNLYVDSDFFRYGVTFDLSAMTYTVDSMSYYMAFFPYDYVYMYEYSLNYYYYYYYSWMYYQLGYGDAYYEMALYYWDLYTEYYYIALDYYSYVYFIWDYDTSMQTTGMHASGMIFPYSMTDTKGNAFTFDGCDIYLLDSGYYYVQFTSGDGATYGLSFILGDEYLDFSGYYSFYVVAFESYESVETTHEENQNYYVVTAGTLLYSDYYASSDVWSLGLVKMAYDGETGEYNSETISGIGIIRLDGDLYYIATGTDDSGNETRTYYKVSFESDVNGKKCAVVEAAAEGTFTEYSLEGGGYLDIYTDVEKEKSEIVLVCVEKESDDGEGGGMTEKTYYTVLSCEKNYDDTYSIILSDGSAYTVTIAGQTATMTPVGAEEEEFEG